MAGISRYYRVVSHEGAGDTYYTFAASVAEARKRCGLDNTEPGDRPLVRRCSKREARQVGYGVHRRF